MIATTLAEVAAVVGGTLHDVPGDGSDTVVTASVAIDSRQIEPGGLFAAFRGEHVDGHDFARAAVGAGAVAVLAGRPVGVPAVVVAEPQAALAQLARHLLDRSPRVRVLGVTGSQGKTSTKDLLAAVLAAVAPTVATRGSLNNELGLPLTVLRTTAETRFLLLEMGARGVGHIRELCAVAPPDVALVLNVGKAHLSEFGSRAGIALAKGELVEALDVDGTAVLNSDDPLVAAMAERTRGRVLTFGRGAEADVRLGEVALDAGGRPRFTLQHADAAAEVTLRLVGEHQAINAAAAAAAAVAVGIPLEEAAASLSRVETLSRWRMEVTERPDGVTVVNDAYNANPDSMAAALRALIALGAGGHQPRRTVAVLGEMRELGASSRAEHEALGRLAARLGVHLLVVVGQAAEGILAGAREELGAAQEAIEVADGGQAAAWLDEHVRPADVVLVKASRGARLDTVAEALLAEGDGR